MNPCIPHRWRIQTRRYTPLPPGPPYKGTVDLRCEQCGHRLSGVPATFTDDEHGVELDLTRFTEWVGPRRMT